MPTRELDIAISTFNFPPIAAMTRSPEWHEAQLAEMGVDGILGSEIHNINPQSLVHGGLLRALIKMGVVNRVHQSWRSKTAGDLPAGYRSAMHETGSRLGAAISTGEEALLVASLPHISTSLDRLGRIQAKSKKRQSIIVHPDVIVHPRDQWVHGQRLRDAPDFTTYQSIFPGRIHYQPTPELLAAWGIGLGVDPDTVTGPMREAELELNARLISNKMARKEEAVGLNKPYLDFQFLTDERDDYQLGDPFSLVRVLAQGNRVAGVQLGWRPGLSHDPAAVKAELDQALKGDLAGTNQGKMLRLASENLPPGSLNLDIELRASDLKDSSVKDYVKANAIIARQARELV